MLAAGQLISDYFMPKGLGTVYFVCFIFTFLFGVYLKVFSNCCTKYFYQIPNCQTDLFDSLVGL